MQRIQTTCLIILTIIAVGVSLYFLRSVCLPFVIALFVVIGCRPILQILEKRLGLNRIIAFGVTFVAGIGILAIFGFLVWASINDLSQHPQAYEKRLNTIANWAAETFVDSQEHAVVDQNNDGIESASELRAAARKDTADAIHDLVQAISSNLQTLLLNLAGSLSSLLSYGVLILIFVFFLLLEDGKAKPHQPELVREIESQVTKYLVMKTVISFFTGLVFGLVLWWFGVPLAILFGMIAFVLNFIPNIGPLIANVLPVPFLLLNSEMDPVSAIICLVLISAVQFVSGNVVETRLMGKSFDVSPTVLLLSLMFFGLIWGIVGMFLATPIVSIVKIVLNESQGGKPVAELLAGRWPAPPENQHV